MYEREKKTMTILYDDALSTKRLPKSHTLLFNSHESPSKLNIKLKTHSLTCLDIPLETFVGFKDISSSFRNGHQKTMAGSVDLISEIQQQSNKKNSSHFSSSKPLINTVSSNQQLPSVQQEKRQILKHRFRMPSSFIKPTSLNNSVTRLRRSGHLRNIHQSSLQTIDKITDRKHRLPLTRKLNSNFILYFSFYSNKAMDLFQNLLFVIYHQILNHHHRSVNLISHPNLKCLHSLHYLKFDHLSLKIVQIVQKLSTINRNYHHYLHYHLGKKLVLGHGNQMMLFK
jgi:hypothetical protein